jgi:hypothetical protein
MAKYSEDDINRLINTPYKDLTPYQRLLVRQATKPRTAAELAQFTGIPESIVSRRIDSAKIDSSSIRFVRGVGFVGKMPLGTPKVFYIVQTQSGQTGYFGSRREIVHDMELIQSGNPPESDFPENVVIFIPKSLR